MPEERPPKPTHLHLMHGTSRRDRHGDRDRREACRAPGAAGAAAVDNAEAERRAARTGGVAKGLHGASV